MSVRRTQPTATELLFRLGKWRNSFHCFADPSKYLAVPDRQLYHSLIDQQNMRKSRRHSSDDLPHLEHRRAVSDTNKLHVWDLPDLVHSNVSQTMPFPADFFAKREKRIRERREQRKMRVKNTSRTWPKNPVRRSSFMVDTAGIGIDKPYIKLRIVAGRNLASHDICGSSDPYCIVKILDQKDNTIFKGETATVWKSLNPKFVDSVFAWPFRVDQSADVYKLRITVYDKDKFSKDDFMGYMDFDLRNGNPSTKLDWFKLKKRKPKEKVSGDLALELDYRSKRMYDIERAFTKGLSVSDSPQECSKNIHSTV